METTFIYGKHVVTEALARRPDIVRSLYVRRDDLQQPLPNQNQVASIKELNPRRLPGGLSPDAVHQGVVAEIEIGKLLIDWKTFKKDLIPTADTALVVLGEIQDTHNVGAIVRSAAAFGARAVLMPEHRQAPLTGGAIKASVGSVFSVPLVELKNVNATLRDLKELGFWVYGLAGDGDVKLAHEQFTRPSVFVVGNEGKGVREKTREICDTILTIPMHPRVESLNASVSAATVLYAWSVQHADALL